MIPEILDSLIQKSQGCWEWLGHKTSNGYGVAYFNKRRRSAHRVVYECLKGEIPIGKELDHLCRNKLCVNPDHLEVVTKSENMKRAAKFYLKVLSSYCCRGHLLEGKHKDGRRYCKVCNLMHKREERLRKRN